MLIFLLILVAIFLLTWYFTQDLIFGILGALMAFCLFMSIASIYVSFLQSESFSKFEKECIKLNGTAATVRYNQTTTHACIQDKKILLEEDSLISNNAVE